MASLAVHCHRAQIRQSKSNSKTRLRFECQALDVATGVWRPGVIKSSSEAGTLITFKGVAANKSIIVDHELCREPVNERIMARSALRIKRHELERLLVGDTVQCGDDEKTVAINDPFLCTLQFEGQDDLVDYEQVTGIGTKQTTSEAGLKPKVRKATKATCTKKTGSKTTGKSKKTGNSKATEVAPANKKPAVPTNPKKKKPTPQAIVTAVPAAPILPMPPLNNSENNTSNEEDEDYFIHLNPEDRAAVMAIIQSESPLPTPAAVWTEPLVPDLSLDSEDSDHQSESLLPQSADLGQASFDVGRPESVTDNKTSEKGQCSCCHVKDFNILKTEISQVKTEVENIRKLILLALGIDPAQCASLLIETESNVCNVVEGSGTGPFLVEYSKSKTVSQEVPVDEASESFSRSPEAVVHVPEARSLDSSMESTSSVPISVGGLTGKPQTPERIKRYIPTKESLESEISKASSQKNLAKQLFFKAYNNDELLLSSMSCRPTAHKSGFPPELFEWVRWVCLKLIKPDSPNLDEDTQWQACVTATNKALSKLNKKPCGGKQETTKIP